MLQMPSFYVCGTCSFVGVEMKLCFAFFVGFEVRISSVITSGNVLVFFLHRFVLGWVIGDWQLLVACLRHFLRV